MDIKLHCFDRDELVCPYCGYEFDESYKYVENEGEVTCKKCHKVFMAFKQVIVTYTTVAKN